MIGTLVITFVVALMLPLILPAQPPPGITENPEGAVRLQTIWRLIGGGSEETRVALAFGPAGDVNNDGYDDFFVTRRLRWDLYLGGPVPSTQPAWSLTSSAFQLEPNNEPIVGNFLGDSTMLVGLRDDRCNPTNGQCFAVIRFFRPHVDSLLVETPWVLDLGEQPDGFRAFARDLDQDEDEELVVINKEGESIVVRIYEGDLDFDLAEPTHMLQISDSSATTGRRDVYSGITRTNSDPSVGLVIARTIPVKGETEVYFWWGSSSGFLQWDHNPDKTIRSIQGEISIQPLSVGVPQDFDGDGIYDPLGVIWTGENAGSYLWLSRESGGAKEATYDEATSSAYYPESIWLPGFGFVADSLQRYEMMSLGRLNQTGDAYGLGGGLYGPNNTYDAHFGGSDGPAFGGIDVGDVDGNGWRDRLAASPTYGGPNVGGAVIIAGGPYIPVDDPTVSVESAPVAGEARGLSLWPNPVVENLHIAWRGDLPAMPHLMRIYNALGELVEERGLPTWEGTTIWSGTGHPAGAYTIVLFDVEDRQLGTLPFVLQP